VRVCAFFWMLLLGMHICMYVCVCVRVCARARVRARVRVRVRVCVDVAAGHAYIDSLREYYLNII